MFWVSTPACRQKRRDAEGGEDALRSIGRASMAASRQNKKEQHGTDADTHEQHKDPVNIPKVIYPEDTEDSREICADKDFEKAFEATLKSINDQEVITKFVTRINSGFNDDGGLSNCCSCGEWVLDGGAWKPLTTSLLRLIPMCNLYDTSLQHVAVDGHKATISINVNKTMGFFCKKCWSHIHNGIAPPFCQINSPAPGDIPAVLRDLWPMEKHVIARQHVMVDIKCLQGGGQRAITGHSYILPNPNAYIVHNILPIEPSKQSKFQQATH